MTSRLLRPRILGYVFSKRLNRIDVNHKFIHICIYSYLPYAGGIDQSRAETQGSFVSWFSDQDLLLEISQESRSLSPKSSRIISSPGIGPGVVVKGLGDWDAHTISGLG